MSWNYRLGTHIFSYAKTFPDNTELAKQKDQRLFSIIEVYYDENGKINGRAETEKTLGNWEDVADLIGTIDLVKLAFVKPILDIDNWPNEWHKELKQCPDTDYTCVECGTGFNKGEICPNCNKH